MFFSCKSIAYKFILSTYTEVANVTFLLFFLAIKTKMPIYNLLVFFSFYWNKRANRLLMSFSFFSS